MIRTSRITPALVLIMIPLWGGCVSSGLSPLNFGVRSVAEHDAGTVFDAARGVLLDRGYAIRRADSAAGTLVTEPIDTADRSRMIVSSKSRFRRVVEVHVNGQPKGVKVYCKAAVQQLVTEAHRLFGSDLSASDRPDATPIERGAATTTEQNTVWQTVRRDKAEEAELLSAILARVDARGP